MLYPLTLKRPPEETGHLSTVRPYLVVSGPDNIMPQSNFKLSFRQLINQLTIILMDALHQYHLDFNLYFEVHRTVKLTDQQDSSSRKDLDR